MHQVPKLKAAKANIRLDFMFADVMKQQGWVKEATLLFVHTNFSAVDLRELRTRAGGMQVLEKLKLNCCRLHDMTWQNKLTLRRWLTFCLFNTDIRPWSRTKDMCYCAVPQCTA